MKKLIAVAALSGALVAVPATADAARPVKHVSHHVVLHDSQWGKDSQWG